MSDVRCPKCQSTRCPELRGTGACPADYARSLPVLVGGIVYAADGTPIGLIDDLNARFRADLESLLRGREIDATLVAETSAFINRWITDRANAGELEPFDVAPYTCEIDPHEPTRILIRSVRR